MSKSGRWILLFCFIGICKCQINCEDENNGGCAQICEVDDGVCSCMIGFELNADMMSCDDIDECLTENGGCSDTCTDNDGSFECSCPVGYILDADGLNCKDDNECDAPNKGGCGDICNNNDGSYTCSCSDGYNLNVDSLACDDINECLTDNGGCSDICDNNIGSYECSCSNGYSLNADGSTCDDIDECLDNMGGCSDICNNNVGSFECSCNVGYSLNADGSTCDEINECLMNNGGCAHDCTNEIGSFSCSCYAGFEDVNSDGLVCNDIDECADDTDGCQQSCNNTEGSFTCGCYPGFYLDTIDMKSCIDHNECNGTDNCEQVCNNHFGGYVCSCELGCQLNADLATCSDIDECSGDNDCDHTCTNLHCTAGRYNCSCNSGYRLGNDDHSCIDINECEAEPSPCDQVCDNNIGSYICDCFSGCSLNVDGTSCDDIDECAMDVCDSVNGDCKNLGCAEGKYICSCNEGYQLGSDNHTCFDINECEFDGSCNQTCTNTDGSYECGCYSGCSIADDGFNCIDINECDEGTHECSQICINTYCNSTGDGYTCSCNSGFEPSSDGYSCNDIDECSRSNDCDQICTNTLGSYTCSCSNDGCWYDSDTKKCTDFNECLLNTTNDCEHICINDNDCDNTVLYTCSCNNGYTLSEDQVSCLDVNECLSNNGGCSHLCTNTIGSYTCSCLDGFELNSDDHSCDGLLCDSNLTSPQYGSINCVGGNVTDSVCTYSCSYGYYLEGNSERVCQPDHTWSGTDPECVTLTCPGLDTEIQVDSLLLLPCEREVDTVCTVVCPDGSYLTSSNNSYYTQTCLTDSQDNTFWSESKTCQAIPSACSPNPCHYDGACNVINNIAVCECPSFTSGTYCESIVLWTPNIPVLTEAVESIEFVLRTRPQISMEITVATDPSVTVLPSPYIVYSADDTEVSFTLRPTKAGFYSIDYVFSNITSDIQPPETTHFTVTPASPTTSLFNEYNITDSVLMRGCCRSDARVHKSLCPLPGQSVWLSSSSCWKNDYQTNGITFIHSGDTELPVSIVGIDSLPFNARQSPDPGLSCEQCRSTSSVDCLSVDVTPTDINEMVEQESLLKTFVTNIEQLLPSSVEINIDNARTDSSSSTDSASYQATFITDKSGLMDYISCQGLELDVNGLMYIIRSDITGSISVGDDINVAKAESTEETCLAVDVCRLPQSPVHISIPNSVQDAVVRTINTQFVIPQNVLQSVFSVSLSSYGTLPLSGDEWFWNGSSMMGFTIPTYDVGVGLFAVKEIHDPKLLYYTFRLSFHGSSYGRINETVPIWLKGWFDVSIAPLFENTEGYTTISLSSSENSQENAIYISEQVNTTDFQPGISMKLRLNDGNQNLLAGSEDCTVQTYINWNSSFYPYYYSLRSDCIVPQILGNLQFPGMTTTTTIPARREYWPSAPDTAVKVTGNNNEENSIDLGRFVSIPPVLERDRSEADQLEYYMSINNTLQSGSVLRGASFEFLDHLLWVDIMLFPRPNFSTMFKFFDRYLVSIDGLATTGFSSWDDMNFRITGAFMDVPSSNSLVNDLTDRVYDLLNAKVQSLANRTALSETALHSALAVMNSYQQRMQSIESSLVNIQGEIENVTKEYEDALAEIEKHRVEFQSHVDLALTTEAISSDKVDEINAECEIINCTQGVCQFTSDVVVCNSTVTYQSISDEEISKLFVVTKQNTKSQSVLSCSIDNICNSYTGVRWLAKPMNSTVWSPLVESENNLPYSYSSHVCQDMCLTKAININVKQNVQDQANQTIVALVTKDLLYQQNKVCAQNNSCAVKFLDEPCTVMNYDCESLRKLRIYSEVPAEMPVRGLLSETYSSFTAAVEASISARSLLERKWLEKKIATEELDIVTQTHEAAMKNYNQAQQTLSALQNTDSTLMDWIQSNGTEQLFQIDSITFIKQLNANDWSSLYTLPLTVEYSVPNSGETYTVEVEVTERVPLLVMMDYVGRYLTDHLLSKITPNDKESYAFESTQSLYENNCILLKEMRWILWSYNQQLWYLNTTYEDIASTLQWDLTRLQDRSSNILASISDLTHAMFRDDMSNALSSYNADVSTLHSGLESMVGQSLQVNWLNIANTYANDGVMMNCSSFVDCLRFSIDLIWSRLLVMDPSTSSLDQLQQASTNTWVIAQSEDLTPAKTLSLLAPVTALLADMYESNGWCGMKPNITTHPMVEMYLEVGHTGTLWCEATSLLPVKYQWWKDGQVLIDETSNQLEITIEDWSDYGEYICEAYNEIGSSYSLPSTVKLNSLPKILTVPEPMVVAAGDDRSVQLSCDGESTADDNYYWRWTYARVEDGDWTVISNTSNVLTLDSIDSSVEGFYRCVLTNMFGTVYSDSFRVTVAEQSLASFSYPISFILQINGEMDSSMIDTIVNTYLRLFTAAQDVNINNAAITWISQGTYELSFDLSSINVTKGTDVVSDVRTVIWKLEQGKANMMEHVESANPINLLNATYTVDTSSLVILGLQVHCPLGYEIDQTLITCVPCTQGYYSGDVQVHYLSSLNINEYYPIWVPVCSPCPKGSYQQSGTGATECTLCPDRYTTTRYGATSISECKALCPPGTSSEDGIHDCKNCSDGYYQPLYGSMHCLSCIDVPGMDGRCPLEVTPSVSNVDRSVVIISASVVGGVILACLVMLCVVIVGLCIRRARRRSRDKEGFDGPAPFRKLSTFGTATRGVPVPEPKGNDLKVNNPIFTGQTSNDETEEVQLKQTNYEGNLKAMFVPEQKTVVTFIDDVDDKSIGETNLSTDVTMPSDLQALIESSLNENADINQEDDEPEIYDIEDKSIGEANMAIDVPVTAEQEEIEEEQVNIADQLVSSAISSAIYRGGNTEDDKRPLLMEDEDEDINQSIALTKELEEELSKQTPTRQSTASEEEIIEGLETITEEDLQEVPLIEEVPPAQEDTKPILPDLPPPLEVEQLQEQHENINAETSPLDVGEPSSIVPESLDQIKAENEADLDKQSDNGKPLQEEGDGKPPQEGEDVKPQEDVNPREDDKQQQPSQLQQADSDVNAETDLPPLPPPIESIPNLPQDEPPPEIPMDETQADEVKMETEEQLTETSQQKEDEVTEELKPTALEEFSDDTADEVESLKKEETPAPPTPANVVIENENKENGGETDSKKGDDVSLKKKDGVMFVINDHDDDSDSNEDGDSRISDEDLDENIKHGKINEIVAGISENLEEGIVVIEKNEDQKDAAMMNDFETVV